MRKPKLWSILRDDDTGNCAIVVEADTPVMTALRELLYVEVGDAFSSTNPVLVAEAAGLRVAVWHYFTKQQREDKGVEEGYWGTDGEGKSFIHVVALERSAGVLAEMALHA